MESELAKLNGKYVRVRYYGGAIRSGILAPPNDHFEWHVWNINHSKIVCDFYADEVISVDVASFTIQMR